MFEARADPRGLKIETVQHVPEPAAGLLGRAATFEREEYVVVVGRLGEIGCLRMCQIESDAPFDQLLARIQRGFPVSVTLGGCEVGRVERPLVELRNEVLLER